MSGDQKLMVLDEKTALFGSTPTLTQLRLIITTGTQEPKKSDDGQALSRLLQKKLKWGK